MFNKIKEKLKNRKLLVVIVLLFFVINIFAIFNTFTEKTSSTIWDGKVATKFRKGDGSLLNPYQISDGGELAYFFSLINGEDSEEYYDKFYSITNNINLNGYDFSFAKFGKSFTGGLNGNGYTVFNFKINKYALDEEKDIAHYELFDSLDSASIRNLNLSDIAFVIDADEIINERPEEEKKEKEKKEETSEKEEETKEEKEQEEENKVKKEEKALEETKKEDVIEKEEKVQGETKEETEEEKKEEDKKEENIVEETAALLKKYDIKFLQRTMEETEEEEKKEEKKEETSEKEEEKEEKKEEKADPSEENKEEKTEEETKEEDKKEETEEKNDEEVKPSEEESKEAKKEEDEEEKEVYVSKITISLFRDVKGSLIHNISVNNISIEYSGDEEKLTSSLFALNDIENNTFENININGASNIESTGVLFSKYVDARLERIIYRSEGLKLYKGYITDDFDSVYEYNISKGLIYFENNYPVKSVLSVLNGNSELNWKYADGMFKIENKGSNAKKKKKSNKRAAPTAHASGTSGTIVYVNDYESDWNYYQGLNYTTASNGALPTRVNKHIYGESNLVYVQLNYYARDIDSQYSAALSATENHNQYVYYKVYPVENNEVKVPLIDNPFTKRPYNKTFNGWITDYEGAVVELDRDIYQRYVTIPVTMTNGVPDNINIDIYATWTNGKIVSLNAAAQASAWNTPLGNLDSNGFHPINYDVYESITPYYVLRSVTNASYPSGAVNSSGNTLSGRCNGTCNYYIHPTGDYVQGTTYYRLQGGQMLPYDIQATYTAEIPVGNTIAGFYRDATVLYHDSFAGYYDSNGNILTSGTCNTSGGCSGYYELIPYYADSNGNQELVLNHVTYYYLTTRDTNIIVFTGSIARTWNEGSQTKPLTLTAMTTNAQGQAVQNHTDGNRYFTIYSRYLYCDDDLRIENMAVYSGVPVQGTNSTTEPSGSAAIIGKAHNVKIGRHLMHRNGYNGYTTFRYVQGGTTTGISNSNFARYKFEVESGIYNNIGLVTVAGNSGSYYVNAIGIFGNDFDRVTENPLETSSNNYNYDTSSGPNMEVKFILSGSWGGNIYGHNAADTMLHTTIKSGRYGSNKTNCFTGVYIGGRTGGAHYATREGVFEGGYVYTVTGGPLSQSSNSSITDTKIYIKGGYQDVVYGGAGTTETYGNKLIQMTGGRVNYSLFGGSNGTTGSNQANSRGTIVGDSYVYVGGTAVVGDPSLVSAGTTLACSANDARYSTVEAGSVFGIGNGRSDSNTIGTMNNSNVIIDGGTINRNVYGGGNFGAVGQNGSNATYETHIIIHDGDIKGSVYGGGNNNGGGVGGNSNNKDNIYISMDGGTVDGSVYGGSRTKGNLFGSTEVTVTGGTVKTDVYGGGEGENTFVEGNVDIVIGDSSNADPDDPNVKGNVYGGSAFGTVNHIAGTNENPPYAYDSSKHVNVTVESGKIEGSVFGGAKGSIDPEIVPYVAGDIAVEINGGTIGSVYGSFDQNGTPATSGSGNNIRYADVTVVINDGDITNVFGGGNQTSIHSTDVTVNGGKVGTLYGGSNQAGSVTSTDIDIKGGEIGTVFGGNNIGGSCTTTNIEMTSGKITGAIYGGGNEVNTTNTNIKITGATANTTIPSVYGGGNKAGVGTTTNDKTYVEIDGSVNITNVYGGSNTSGTVTKSDVVLKNGTVGSLYGGNNAGGQTNDTNIRIDSGTVTSVFGGGNKAVSGTTHVTINDTSSSGITNVFGGGNEAACTTTSVTINGNHGTITNVYGGGNNVQNVAAATTTTVTITDDDVNITNLFGGSNTNGDVTTTNVLIEDGTIASVYGGNNAGGNVTTSNVHVEDGIITTVYGGNNAGGQTSATNVEVDTGTITEIYGGGNEAISGTTSVVVNNTTNTVTNIFGGGNKASTGDTSVVFNNGKVTNIYGGGNEAAAEDTSVVVNAASATITSVYGGGNKAGATSTTVTIGPATGTAVNVTSVYGGSNTSGNVGSTSVTTNKSNITDLYGGNNAGGESAATLVTVNGSSVSNLYGGGNQADSGDTVVVVNSGTIVALYGGGNAADVDSTDVTINNGSITVAFGAGNGQTSNVNNDTSIKLLGGSVDNNIYGGGNNGTVSGDTDVLINNATVYGSAYAGGNGASAIVTGDTTITVSGTSVIGTSTCSNYSNCSVFGGGNAAETGTVATPATATVNIIGGTIYGNVYGGANTSKVYGNTDVTIGNGVTPGTNIVKGDIHIRGTVFGGGEANASGSTTYDFSFISVTQGVTIDIDGYGYNNFDIDGSIFGSGNASSSEGDSYVTIKNYGTFANPKDNVSIQRATLVTIDNSAIVLSGTTDRTNEYSDVLFSLSRVTELDIKNNTTLFLENGANLLEDFKSLNADGTKATVQIDDNGNVTRSTDNRLYIYMGRHLDIAKDQNATDMGEVYGMTFFGMYKYNNDNSVNVGIYGEETAGDDVDWSKVIDNVTSYVAGLHKDAHNIEVDGFYTNFANEETQKYDIDYITPTPPTGPLYMWIIGAGVIEYEAELNASRYSTLGTTELSLRDFTHPNTTFAILGFDYSELNAGIELIERQNVKKIADTSTEANTVMGISMETSNAGWLNNGQTSFVTDPDPEDCVIGTTSYVKGNYSGAPTVLLYLHHSKNISQAGNMGKVRIQLMSIRQTGPLDKETKRLIITLDLNRTLYDTISYEGSMTAGRKYEMFASTATNISSTSSISAYYALFATDENIYKTGYHRTLVSTFAFPENTKITMIDLSGSAPEYYYKTISASDYSAALQELQNVGEVSYNVSMFEAMGAENSGVHYNDATKNTAYYSPSPEYCEEEFIFIIDFADTTINSNYLSNKLLLEMRNSNDATIYSVLAPQHTDLTYNIYANSDAVIDMSGTISSNKIYNGDTFNVDLTIDYTQSTVGSVTVYDTHYFDSKLGIKISLINDQGNVVTGTTLLGLNYTIDEVRYDPNIDGTTRIKIADKVDSAEKWVIIDTGTSAIATGHYKLRIESFGSPDGIYYGLTASDMIEFNIEIINEIYGLNISTTPEEMSINSETGKNENGENSIGYTIVYNSGLTQPNIRFKLYRRNYNNIDDTTYTLVDAQDYFADTLDASSIANEYIIRDEPDPEFNVEFETKDDLVSGTYKMEFELYDDTALIGTVDKYFIIK